MLLNSFRSLLPAVNRSALVLSQDTLLKSSVIQSVSWLHTTDTLERARKGTRIRKLKVAQANRRKKLAKMPERPKGYVPYAERQRGHGDSPRQDWFAYKPDMPDDDVFVMKYYKWPRYTVKEGVEMFRLSNHPEVFNLPDALLYLYVELSMATEKKTRFLASVGGVVTVPAAFDSGQKRSVAVLTDDPEQQAAALEAGAGLVMGREVVGLMRSKEVSVVDYDYVVSDLQILPELSSKGIKSLFKRKFPNTKDGTAVADTSAAVKKFLTGIKYNADVHRYDKDFATLEIPVGRISMCDDDVKANVAAIMEHVFAQRGKKSSQFVSNVRLLCPPTKEMFYLDMQRLGLSFVKPEKPQEQVEDKLQEKA